jgi:hypothetical protein
MGRHSAGFNNALRWNLDPKHIVQRLDLVGVQSFPRERFTLIGLDTEPICPLPLFFDHHTPEPAIVRFELAAGPRSDDEIAFASFHELLLIYGANFFCFETLPYQRRLQLKLNRSKEAGGIEDDSLRCRIALEKMGFASLLPPTPNAWLGRWKETVVNVDRPTWPEAITFFVYLSAPTEADFDHVIEALRLAGVA